MHYGHSLTGLLISLYCRTIHHMKTHKLTFKCMSHKGTLNTFSFGFFFFKRFVTFGTPAADFSFCRLIVKYHRIRYQTCIDIRLIRALFCKEANARIQWRQILTLAASNAILIRDVLLRVAQNIPCSEGARLSFDSWAASFLLRLPLGIKQWAR